MVGKGGDLSMSQIDSKTSEEKLLEAIGDLPEDIIASTANPPVPKMGQIIRESFRVARWIAMAAAVGVIVWGISRSSINLQVKKADTEMVQNQDISSEYKQTEQKEKKALSIWTYTGKEEEPIVKKKKISENDSVSSMYDEADSLDRDVSQGEERMVEGKTIKLLSQAEEDASLVFRVGEEESQDSYYLTVMGVCKISAIVESNCKREEINQKQAACKAGDMIYLDLSQLDSVEKEENLQVSAWKKKEIETIAAMRVELSEEKEENSGVIYIGKKRGKYYGIYQEEN